MFDFHMHSLVSFDGKSSADDMIRAAIKVGLNEICFTDHLDYDPLNVLENCAFDPQLYNETYNNLYYPDIIIRKGMEFGMLPDNRETFYADIKKIPFDFVIGSVHFVDDIDIYLPEFWEGKSIDQAEYRCLEQTLECVKVHDGFDVLGHLTYPSKAGANPMHRPIVYDTYKDIVDEIFRILVDRGQGIEVNTSGVDPCGVYLPALEYLRRFKELGGEIVTVGSDAHDVSRVGQYCNEASQMVSEIFGYVCTFENRKPIFHKL